MRPTFLTKEQDRFLQEEKTALGDIRLELARLAIPTESLGKLLRSIVQLDELFLLVVVGEFNSGKSALVNALLGSPVLPEGATPTTSRVTLVKWGEEVEEEIIDSGFAILTHPLPLLKQVNVVDTPGTNAVIRQHERLTDEFVPRSDLVLFVTSADRPLTESERQFLERITAWGKKVVFVINKIDILLDESTRGEVRDFVQRNTYQVMGESPPLFPVSARVAQQARREPDQGKRERLWNESGVDELEDYIVDVLDDDARLELKLRNPLGIADRIIRDTQEAVAHEQENLQEDLETVEAIEISIDAYAQELKSELEPRLAAIENILHRLEQRGLDFFDTTLRLTNIAGLARGAQVRAQFEEQVIDDVPEKIEDQVKRLIDWLVSKDLHEWRQVMGYLQRRQASHAEHIVGEPGAPSTTRRQELIDTVGRKASEIVEGYDRNQEARELAIAVESAVAQTAILEAGAVGLGTLITIAVFSSAVDITGLLAAGTMAILGFFVIPYKRRQAKEDFQVKMTRLRSELGGALTSQFQVETEQAIERMRAGVAPYTRYVHAEAERLESAAEVLADLRKRVDSLQARVASVV